MASNPHLPNSSSPVVVWRCDDCGWTILDDNAVDGQPCEAWLNGETEEHGTCLRLVMVPAEVTDEMVERAREALVAQTCGHDESGLTHWPERSRTAYLTAIEDTRVAMPDILAAAFSTTRQEEAGRG